LAAATVAPAGTQVFSNVTHYSAKVNWSSGTNAGGFNGPGATYLVQASSQSDFSTITNSSTTANIFATVGLSYNTTYYFRVMAYNTIGQTDYSFAFLGSTLTSPTGPTDIVFEEISTRAITASAYVPGLGDLSIGQAGVNVAINGVYAGWRNGNKWVTRAPLLTPRNNLAAAVVGGKIYAIGGRVGTGATYLTHNEEYDPVANSWVTRAPMPTARAKLSAEAIAGKIYAVDGTSGYENEEYDPVSNVWTSRRSMPSFRYNMASGVVGGKMYAIGGLTYDKNEEYDPAVDRKSVV
jgi:hypothetical protein